MAYPYVRAKWDYGPRPGAALGLLYHMAEGGGTVHYLSKAGGVLRGVSVHAVCEYSGRVVQMLPWHHVSGSLNPSDRSTDKLYYGHRHLVDVLGPKWTDPNTVTLSMEIEGFANLGPNAAQVDAAVAWGEDMKGQFSSLRGAVGHADQTDTKRCPGTTLAMKLIFEGVGGHGLWHPQSGPNIGEPMIKAPTRIGSGDVVDHIPAGTDFLDGPGGNRIGDCPPTMDYAGLWGSHRAVIALTGIPYPDNVPRRTIVAIAATAGRVRAKTDAELVAQAEVYHECQPPTPPPLPNCDAAVAAEHQRTLQQAKDALEALP